jgi:hypothetical protein
MRCYGVMADGCAGQWVARVAWVAGGGLKTRWGRRELPGNSAERRLDLRDDVKTLHSGVSPGLPRATIAPAEIKAPSCNSGVAAERDIFIIG